MKKFFLFAAALTLISLPLFSSGTTDSASSSELAPVTITYNVYNTTLDYEKDDVYRWVEEEFNVELKRFQASGADWQEKLQIWVASGDMPDVMNWDFKYHHMPQYNEWVRLGALRPLPEDLSKYPNLKNDILDKMVTDDLLRIDGKRYALPHVRSYAYMPGEQL
ncbi:MAG: extracellular solute-binding protein, partial [Spirochaetales bacterium]|nr:extracellular solute-binding protein [Spirochaetales bacterium]